MSLFEDFQEDQFSSIEQSFEHLFDRDTLKFDLRNSFPSCDLTHKDQESILDKSLCIDHLDLKIGDRISETFSKHKGSKN